MPVHEIVCVIFYESVLISWDVCVYVISCLLKIFIVVPVYCLHTADFIDDAAGCSMCMEINQLSGDCIHNRAVSLPLFEQYLKHPVPRQLFHENGIIDDP